MGSEVVGLNWAPPLDVDEHNHEADQSKENEEASEDVENELLELAEVDTVHGIDQHTEVKMEVGNDDSKLLLNVVGESQVLGSKSLGGVHTEGVDTISCGALVRNTLVEVLSSLKTILVFLDTVTRAKPIV